MKIAIIGAGLAGLACAHELERHGITPVLYEQKSFVGDVESHVAAVLNVVDRPVTDWVEYAGKNYNIILNPANPIKILTHYSPNRKTTIKGNFGCFFPRGPGPDCLIPSLYSQLSSTRVVLNRQVDIDEVSREYDYVVVANGSHSYTNQLGCWREWIAGWVRGAVVLGDFDPTELVMWISKDYCKEGYAYLTPFSDKKASITLFVPYVDEHEVDRYWELYLYSENIGYTVVEEYKRRHIAGYVYPHRLNNIFFAGIAGGALDPFLGFGSVSSIIQGASAAKAISEGKDYEKLIAYTIKKSNALWEFRKAFNNATGRGYDLLLTAIGLPVLKHVVYHTNINVLKYGSLALKLGKKLHFRSF